MLGKPRNEQTALAARTRVPGHVLALLELLVDLAGLLLALFERLAAVVFAVVLILVLVAAAW